MALYKRLIAGLMLAAAMIAFAGAAVAGVTTTISGNQAISNISLQSGLHTYTAQVTIEFDAPVNLTASELNLTAQVVNPYDWTLQARLGCILSLLGCPVSVDPAFPVMITVEPLNAGAGSLQFRNIYAFEVHTADLDCSAPQSGASCPATNYRLFKAPVGGSFADVTSDVLKGSVRARGTGGSFSQFLVVRDQRPALFAYLQKATALLTRITVSTLDSVLEGGLLDLLGAVNSAVILGDYAGAVAALDQLIALIQGQAGAGIANVWSSDHTLINDAGDLESLANTLRYTLVRLQNGG